MNAMTLDLAVACHRGSRCQSRQAENWGLRILSLILEPLSSGMSVDEAQEDYDDLDIHAARSYVAAKLSRKELRSLRKEILVADSPASTSGPPELRRFTPGRVPGPSPSPPPRGHLVRQHPTLPGVRNGRAFQPLLTLASSSRRVPLVTCAHVIAWRKDLEVEPPPPPSGVSFRPLAVRQPLVKPTPYPQPGLRGNPSQRGRERAHPGAE